MGSAPAPVLRTKLVPGTKLTQQYCLHAVYMQAGTGNFIPKKEAILYQARICRIGGEDV